LDDWLIAVRAIHFASTAIVAGAVIFAFFVAEPELKAASPSTSRFRAQMAWLLWINFAVAVASGAAWLVLLAAQIGDRALTMVFSDGIAWTVLTQTRFGWVWQLRLLCAAMLAGLLLIKPQSGHRSRWSGLLAISVAVGLLGTLAWAGHGGATPGRAGYLHLGADFLHLVAAGVWLGSLIPLALLLGQQRQADDDDWGALAIRATHRFSDIGVVSVITILASGIVNTWFLSGGVEGLVTTDYGRLLLMKIALFVAMICFATVNRFHLLPQSSSSQEGSFYAMRAIQRNALIEMLLGLGVIVIVAFLGTLPPAAHMHAAGHLH
jgi:putative copper resistance protein D